MDKMFFQDGFMVKREKRISIVNGGIIMRFDISSTASDYINQKGGEIIIFKGNLSGCCGGNIPTPSMEVGHPRRPLENYQQIKEAGVILYIDNDLLPYQGIVKIGLEKNLFWKSLSFSYREELLV